MSEITVIVCDACGGNHVQHYTKPSVPTIVERSMSEIANNAKTTMGVPAVYIYTQYILHCADCGHTVKYQA